MDGNFFRKSVTPPPIPEFVFDLQRFDFKIAESAPAGALFSVIKSDVTYYGTDASDFTTDNLANATTITLLSGTPSSYIKFSNAVSLSGNVEFNTNGKSWEYTGTGSAITVVSGTLTKKGTGTLRIATTGNASANIFEVANGATLDVQAGTITGGTSGVGIKSNGNLTIGTGSPTISGGSTGVEVDGGSIVVNKGTIKNSGAGTALKINGEISNSKITDGTIGDTTDETVALELTNSASGTVDIYGGTFNTKNGTAIKKDSSSTATVNISATKEDGTTASTAKFIGSFDGVTAPLNSVNLAGVTTYFSSKTAASNSHCARIDDVYYATFLAALNAANKLDTIPTITLTRDCSFSMTDANVKKNMSLDLNGCTLTFDAHDLTVQSDVEFTLKDSSTEGSGLLTSSAKSNATKLVRVQGTFTMESGNISVTGNRGDNCAIIVAGNATANINGGTVSSVDSFAVCSNGTNDAANSNAHINISGGTLTSTNAAAVYAPSVGGTTNISGGTITGTSGIEIRAGELNVTGGTITSTATEYSVEPNGNGSTTTGAGIAVAQHTTKKEVTLNISGNNTQISGANALAVSNPQNNTTSKSEAVSATISGGNLKSTATATSGNSQNGNAILADNANVNITVTDGNLDGNVTVSKDSSAADGTDKTTLKMEGGTTSGKVQVVEATKDSDGKITATTETRNNEEKKKLQVTGGTYTDTVSANNYTDDDTTINSDGTVVNKGAGWSLRSDSTYDYLISAGGSTATLLTATFASAPTDSSSVLKFDATNNLLGIADSATDTAWSSTPSIASLQGNYALATFTTSGNAITIAPQTISTAEGQTYRGVKISGTDFIGNATELTATLGEGLAASLYGVNVDATNNKLTKITGGAGNDNLLAGDRNSTLDGGNGDNVLQGGTGNDSLKGGTGKDVFYYTAGSDTVNSFGTGDIVRTTLTAVTDGSKLTTVTGGFKLTFSNSNSLTFTDAAVPVSLSDGTNNYIYTQDFVKQGNGVTLGANTATFNGETDSLSAVTTIDASAVTGNLDLTDNTNNNYIVAGKGKNTFNLKGGNDTISGYDTVDVVNLGELTAPTSFDNVNFDTSDYAINFDSGNALTFKGALQVVLTKDNNTYTYNRNSIAWADNGITLGSAYTSNFNGASDANSGYATIDASAVTKAINITGNSKENLIYGGQGGGTLLGGTGEDSLVAGSIGTFLNGQDGADSLVGGAGNDTFAYTSGADSISGFNTNDLVSVAAGIDVAGANVSISGGDLILDFDGSKLTFEDGATSTISLKSGRHDYLFSANSIVSGNSITLTADYASSIFSAGTAYDNINAEAVGRGISITGNDNGNYIIGSSAYANSLTGGKGNDTFRGGSAADVFFYTSGNDVIQNFGEGGDSLSIADSDIDKARASNRRLTFTMKDKGTLVFRSDDSIPAQISLQGGGYLTADGVVKDTAKSLNLFTSAKGRIDLGDTLYSGASIESVSAANVSKQSVTLVGGSDGGKFTFAGINRKRDGFEYNGGAVSISGYEAGKDRINLGDDSISAFSIHSGDVLFTLAGDNSKFISLNGAAGSEVMIHQDGINRGNSYSKMVFAETGVVYDKAASKATNATIWGGMTPNSIYDAGEKAAKLKKITLKGDVEKIAIQAGGNNTIIDASAAGAVSLISGAKNDKFTGSSNADMFVYTGGKDIFQSFGEADSISLNKNLYDAKITANKKSIKFKFGTKDVLTIKPTKSDTLSGELNINGETRTYGKNSIADDGNVSLTSQFGGTYKIDGVSTVDGHLVKKKLTIKGTASAESLIGGIGKTLFKGAGGNDTLQGGDGADTFFYAKGDAGTVTIADFDFEKDKLKIASGTIAKVSMTGSGVQFAMKNGRGESPAVGWFNVETTDAKDVLIKANNTYYWFATGNETLASADDTLTADKGALITSTSKISNSQISGYAVIDLNYSTNLIKSDVAVQVKDTLKAHT